MRQEGAFRLLMQLRREHVGVPVTQRMAKPPAGGGCGLPATVSPLPLVSTSTVQFVTLVAVSALVKFAFVPLCGSTSARNTHPRPSKNVIKNKIKFF